ncbi:MAG: cell division protein ZapA [Gammaproteobacteria bacterium]|nr:cell division protein ZapA [Gammaproteobacteria bacterium]
MSGAAKPVTVKILDKDYLVSCSDSERDQLHTAVAYLNGKMLEVKNAGKVVGTERIAVMAALNIAHELLACRVESDHYNNSVDDTVRRLQIKIDEVLGQGVALEM